jgi:molecular chaperone DnaK (HSP70)
MTDEAKPEEKKEQPEQPQPEQQYEIKKRSKKNFTCIPFKTQSYALDPNQRKFFHEKENELKLGDMDILEMKELRNNLEAYSYEMRNNLDSYGTWEKYLDEPTKQKFLQEINQVVDWIYGDGEQAPKEEYQKKI